MGMCMSSQKLAENTFRVVNINDDKRLVRKGTMEVTMSDLIYTDSKSRETWQWPLKHLRKYGCDGNVFSFEAGRKCPGGEGLYAFSTQRASALFNMVAFNINQGNLQSPGGTDLEAPQHFHRPPSESVVPPPDYQNVGLPVIDIAGPDVGACAISDVPKPDSPPSVTETGPKKFQYREVVFDKPAQEHPPPPAEGVVRTPYSEINFERTQEMSRHRFASNGSSLSFSYAPRTTHHILTHQQHPHSHTTLHGHASAPASEAPPPSSSRRQRFNTFTNSPCSPSSSSLSSQNSMTESLRDIKSPQVNGVLPAGATPDQHLTYQNVVLSPAGPTIPEVQPNYQNVNVEAGQLTVQVPQPNYTNITPGPNVAQMQPNYHNITPLPTVHSGEPLGNYADLDIPGRTSTPVEPVQPSYMQLNFTSPGPGESSVPGPHPGGRTSPEPVRVSIALANGGPTLVAQAKPSDDQPLDYSVVYQQLNFPAMQGLSDTSKQREKELAERQEMEREKEREKERERERLSSHPKKHK